VRPGDTVYATGIVRADGVLAEAPAAGRCSVSHSASSGGYGASLNGTLQAIDADGLVVGGVRVRWLPETAFYAAYTGARREPSELVVGERVSVHVTAAPIAGRGFASQVSPFVADDTSADATLRVDAAVPQVAADAVGLLGRPVRIDRATAAGLRDCNEGDPVVPLEPAEFMRFVFSGGYPRLVRMSVATDAAGEWRATSIVANDKPYCD
jgi:hypothetical protein